MKNYSRILHVLSVLASSYMAAALIGLLLSAFVFIMLSLNFDWDATTALRFAVPIVAAGPLVACALVFSSRVLIDVSLRVFPNLTMDGSDGETSRPILGIALVSLFLIAFVLLFATQIGGGGASRPMERCVLSRAC